MTLPLFSPEPFTDRKPPPNLRAYQERAIVNLRAQVILGRRRILAVAPTSAGKMLMTAAITKLSTIPMLFIGHRMELLDQCASQLGRFGLTEISVIRGADERYNMAAPNQVASIQTLARRDKPFLNLEWQPGEPPHVLIFIDEAHRAASDSYVEHVFRAYPGAVIIGWTATPCRLDGRPLGGELFEVLEQIATYEELLKRPDWLAHPDVYGVPIKPDVSGVRMSGSDFDEDALAEVVRTDTLEGQIVEHWLRLAHLHPVFNAKGMRVPQQFTEGLRRRTVGFFVNIAHSQSVAARFEKAIGPKVAHLDGKTKESERRAIWRDLGSGELEIVCNCNVGTEGVDVPEIKCVIAARPTHSLVMHRQQTGREMRPWRPSDDSPWVVPILLDHAGNFDRLGCPFEDMRWSLSNRPARLGGRLPMKLCRSCFAYCAPNQAVCPFCGAESPRAEDRPLPAESPAELLLRQTEPDELRRAFFSRQVIIAKQRGFRPGYAGAMYREKYGLWPPREWSERVKGEYAQDGAWQMTLKRRLERKIAREEQEKREDEKLKADEAPEENMSEEEKSLVATQKAMDLEEESFSDWLDGG